jgi:hypothetical protein
MHHTKLHVECVAEAVEDCFRTLPQAAYTTMHCVMTVDGRADLPRYGIAVGPSTEAIQKNS